MEEQKNSSEIIKNESLYFDQISEYPLLKPEEEIELGRLIKEGRDDEKEEARHKLTESNLRLVVTIAKRYISSGVPFSDLIQEGNIGLMQAVERYDYALGYRFSTYAAFWIKKYITKFAANQSKIAEYINTENDSEQCITDGLADENAISPEDALDEEFLHEELLQALNTLSDKEKKVLALRFGLEDGKIHTLDELSGCLGVTIEGVRKIELAALRKLRNSENHGLKEYL